VILEPVVGNSGFIPPVPGFLEGIRELTKENGALLVFDEVMTGFRISYGGAQAKFGITPDLTTMGKVIGGGLPVGAYGGRADIMAMVAPAGPMYQAGTLSGNPLAMTAGIKTLELLKQPGTYERLEAITKRLIEGILEAGKAAGLPITGGSISAMFGFFLCEGPVRNFEEAKAADAQPASASCTAPCSSAAFTWPPAPSRRASPPWPTPTPTSTPPSPPSASASRRWPDGAALEPAAGKPDRRRQSVGLLQRH
jgi:glutamate-1-semialdehyde aminotransferase